MDWNAWHTLVTVASTGTYDAAAELLRIDPTTISRRIRQLETQYGGRLLFRSGGKLRPTPACEALLPQLETAAQALAALPGQPHGRTAGMPWRIIRITAVGYICDHLLARSVDDLPLSSVFKLELASTNRNLSLSRREADFALRFAPSASGHTPCQPLGEVRYGCFAARGHDPKSLPWASVDSAYAHLPEAEWVEKIARDNGGIRLTATTMQGLIEIVRSGAARALLPKFAARHYDDLKPCMPEGGVTRRLWLLWHREAEETASHREVKAWILRTAQALLDESEDE